MIGGKIPIPDENQLSGIRKYLPEVLMLTLSACVVYLFITYHTMNKFIQDSLFKNNVRMEIIINNNTRVIERVSRKLKIENEVIINDSGF